MNNYYKRIAQNKLYLRDNPPIKTVEIPSRAEHWGIHRTQVKLVWVCPKCGKPRGKLFRILSYDGSRRMLVDGWSNACGHIDYYSEVRKEARENGLN